MSVVLTVLNEASSISPLVDAILGQSRPPDEVVIVDGGSRDGTRQILEAYTEKVPGLRVRLAEGVNIARGRNIAIAMAIGDVIAVTDGGCRPDVDWLKALLEPLEQDPGVGAVAGRIVVESRTAFEHFSGLLSSAQRDSPTQATMFYGRSSAFRKSLWERVGGYPEWLYTAEDSLFALRAGQLGFRVAYAPASLLFWRPRPTLRKLAKMFYLYGRGNGRINWGDLRGSWYWLRYHLLWAATAITGFVAPGLWAVTVLTLGYLYYRAALPTLREVRKQTDDVRREWYVPLIVILRNLATNLGYVVGQYEYRFIPGFRENLSRYLGTASALQ